MTRLLITGGAGFIGCNFVHYWAQHRPEDRLVVLDALTYAGRRSNLADLDHHPGFRFVRGDIVDQPLVESLLAEEKLDTVVNFAAESHVDRSIADPDAFIRTNIVGTHALLAAATKVWRHAGGWGQTANLFHQVSTDEVYGSLAPAAPPFRETTPYAPNSPYAASKAAADHLVRAYHRTYGLPVTISNCSNNYGPYQFPEKLIPLMLTRALQGLALPVYGDGANIRDWLQVEDHCRGIALIIERGRRGETYLLGADNQRDNLEIVRTICDLLDGAFKSDPQLAHRFPACPRASGRSCHELITFVADRLGHDRRYAVDPARARTELGYVPRHDFTSGLRATLAWYLEHQDWWHGAGEQAHNALEKKSA